MFTVIAAILEFLAFPFRLVFGPLSGFLDRRLALAEQREFQEEIRRDASSLFDVHGGVVVENQGVPFPPGFDIACVTVLADGMLFRFVKGRGDFYVQVASADRPQQWTDLDVLLSAIETPDHVHRQPFAIVYRAGVALEKHWDGLRASLQRDSVRQALSEFAEREDVHRKAFERELNRRLYDK